MLLDPASGDGGALDVLHSVVPAGRPDATAAQAHRPSPRCIAPLRRNGQPELLTGYTWPASAARWPGALASVRDYGRTIFQ